MSNIPCEAIDAAERVLLVNGATVSPSGGESFRTVVIAALEAADRATSDPRAKRALKKEDRRA